MPNVGIFVGIENALRGSASSGGAGEGPQKVMRSGEPTKERMPRTMPGRMVMMLHVSTGRSGVRAGNIVRSLRMAFLIRMG
jgi:hypothetical protein